MVKFRISAAWLAMERGIYRIRKHTLYYSHIVGLHIHPSTGIKNNYKMLSIVLKCLEMKHQKAHYYYYTE